MKQPTSITLRLTFLFSASATIVFLAFGWIIGQSIEEHFSAEDNKELRVIAKVVEQSLSMLQSKNDVAHINQRFDDLLVGHHGALLHVSDASGKLLYHSSKVDFSLMPIPSESQLTKPIIQQWNNNKHNYRVLTQKVSGKNSNSYTVITAVATDFHLHFLNEFRLTLWLMVISGIVVMGLMGWIAVRHGHRPLHHMVEQISSISANDLNTRLDPNTIPAEFTELALSFNELLERMEEAFIQLSNFSSDIAHELRTPVTNLMTQTQVALSQARSAKEYQETLYSNMEEFDRMAQMVGDMLFLAKSDNGLTSPNITDVDLEKEFRNLFDYYEAWAEECQVLLAFEGNAHVKGDSLMLRRALSNLLSNAIRHTPEGNTINIQLRHSGDEVFIIIQNPGTPIPSEHLPRLFDRFYRVDPSRQRNNEGAGLGLAIVKSIIEAHGGKIVATSNESCTQFHISLPASTEHND